MVHCSQKGGEVVPGVLEAAGRSMVRGHEDEAQLSGQRRASAVGGVQGNGGRGGNRRSGRKPDQGNAERGGNRSRRETAVDESRKEMARQASKAPGGPGSRTCLCYSCLLLVPLVRTGSSFVVFPFFALDPL